jgi:hypothetical protein
LLTPYEGRFHLEILPVASHWRELVDHNWLQEAISTLVGTWVSAEDAASSGSFHDEKNSSLSGLQGGLGRGPPSHEGERKSKYKMVWCIRQGGLLVKCKSHPIRGRQIVSNQGKDCGPSRSKTGQPRAINPRMPVPFGLNSGRLLFALDGGGDQGELVESSTHPKPL